MLIEGLYCVQFQTPLGAGAGVISLRDGQLRGGDSAIFYTGAYHQDGDSFSAKVQTGRHSAGLATVFGRDAVTIEIAGKSDGVGAQLTGTSPQPPV